MAITRTTLGAAVDSNDLRDITLASTTGLAAGDLLVVGNEIMQVNSIPVAGTAKVQRGMRGTAAQNHASGASVEFGPPGDFGAPGSTQVDGGERGSGLSKRPIKEYTAAGAISVQEGIHVINGTTLAMTIAAPDEADDGKRLTIVSENASAHTLTNTTPGFNGGGTTSDVGTFGGAIGDGLEIVAVNGVWLVVANQNVTLA